MRRLLFVVLALASACAHRSTPCSFLTGEPIPTYTAGRARSELTIDGRLDEESWQGAAPTSRFVDLMSGGHAWYDTHGRILWDDQYLYVGIRLEEPDVAGTYTTRDAPLYRQNNAELFVAGESAYYELEINALGTLYEAFFVWQDAYEKDGYAEEPQLSLDAGRRIGFRGVGYRDHPRGPRHAFLGYDLPGLLSAVQIDGTLNDDSDEDTGWTVELALPWESLRALARGDGRPIPPEPGDVWHMNLFRFNSYKEPPPAEDSGAWAWARHGVWDSHVPEVFPRVRFEDRAPSSPGL